MKEQKECTNNYKKSVGNDALVVPKLKRNTQNGITLIALIITIIVLLILAMVSIKLVLDGGIIIYLKNAVSQYSREQELERVRLAVADAKMLNNGGNITKENLENAIKSEFGKNNYTITGDKTPFTVIITNGTGIEYIIDDNGNVTLSENKDSGDEKIGKWIQTEEGITDGTVMLQIGDYINYDEGKGTTYIADTTKGVGEISKYNSTTKRVDLTAGDGYKTKKLNWRVLGINTRGELELICDNPITKPLYIANEEGYLYGPDELDKMCNELYGKGAYSIGARSLNVEDINKITGYDLKKYSGYGDIWSYRFPISGDYIQFKKTGSHNIDWTDITGSDYQTFRMPGETNTISSGNRNDEGKSLEYTYYQYNITNTITNSIISDMITKGTGSSYKNQWLASRCVYVNNIYAMQTPVTQFGIRRIMAGYVDYQPVYNSTDYGIGNSACVRPVVILQSNIQIDKDGKNGTSADEAYEIRE